MNSEYYPLYSPMNCILHEKNSRTFSVHFICIIVHFCFLFTFAPSHYLNTGGGGTLARSESRNSINNDHGGGGLSIASMGSGRHSALRAQTPSRRGSSVYIGGDDSGVYLLFVYHFCMLNMFLKISRACYKFKLYF